MIPLNSPLSPVVDLTTLNQDTSSQNSGNNNKLNFMDQLSRRHEILNALPHELSPPSCPSSPQAESRSELLRERLLDAVNASNGEPSNPKWGLVHRMLRMGCTSRGYRGVASGVRVGNTSAVDIRDYEWVLPDTEEQWNRCEQRWNELLKGPIEKRHERPSKYWAKNGAEGRPSLPLGEDDWPKTRSQRIREKVENWQARLVSVEETSPQSSSNDVPKSTTEKEIVPVAISRQTSLVFHVSKHGGSGTKGIRSRDAPSMDPQLPTSSPMEIEDPPLEVDQVEPADQPPPQHSAEQPAVNIADVSEMVGAARLRIAIMIIY